MFLVKANMDQQNTGYVTCKNESNKSWIFYNSNGFFCTVARILFLQQKDL